MTWITNQSTRANENWTGFFMQNNQPVPFFVPGAASTEMAERQWRKLRESVKQSMGFEYTDRRVYAASYNRRGKMLRAVVGQRDEIDGDLILAIFESANCWVVCTQSRDGRADIPILIGQSPFDVVDFATAVQH
jgi:hypothetical protein